MSGLLSLPVANIIIYLDETYLIEEGFENYNATGWTENINGSGTLTVPLAAAAKRQNYGLRSEITSVATRDSAALYKTFTNTDNDPVYVNFWFRLNSTTLDEDDMAIIFFTTSGLSVVGQLEIVESGSTKYLRLMDKDGNTYGTSANPIVTGTWYHVRVGFKNHTTAGVVYLELDGTVIVNETPTMDDDSTIGAIFVGVDDLYAGGHYAMQVDYDEVYVGLDLIDVYMEPHDETILGIGLHLGATQEISGFEVVFDRGNPDYDNEMDPGEDNVLATGYEIDIYLGRGSSLPLLLVGQIEDIEYEDEVEEYAFRNVVRCRGRCKGYQLFGRKYNGDLITAVGTGYMNYERSSGDASSLVAYLIDNYTSLKHVRVYDDMASNAASGQATVVVTDGTKFTANDLVKIEDDNGWEYNRIASISTNTLTMANNLVNAYTTAASGRVYIDLIERSSTTYTQMQYTYTTIYEILKFICDTADLSGVIGYDMRVEYDGRFAFFSKNSKTESYNLQDVCQINRYRKDALRIKNKIWVFGKADKPYPLDVDGQAYSDSWSDYATPMTRGTLNADSGVDDTITLTAGEGAKFAVGNIIWIKDDTREGEEMEIESINGDDITFTENLSISYTTANNAWIWKLSGWTNTQGTNSTIVAEATTKSTGTYSVEGELTGAASYLDMWFYLKDSLKFSADEYNKILVDLYVTANFNLKVTLTLISVLADGSVKTATRYLTLSAVTQWEEFEFGCGTINASQWSVQASFDWTRIVGARFRFNLDAANTGKVYIDRFYFGGKRWGGGSDNAASDGFAEDSTSQTTYGIREFVVINDLLLSDAECEAKAQGLLASYKDEKITIELNTDSLDWSTYHPMAANKVATDLDLLGVTGSTYRIDSIDIIFRSADNSLAAYYTLGATPARFADYLYRLSERLRQIERDYEKIR